MTGKIAILASTNGSDILGIIEAIKQNKLDAEISIIITNKECGALELAKNNSIKNMLIKSKGKEREEFDKEVSNILEENEVDLIMLIGYMRYLSKWFVNKYSNKIMNIHPSLLPAFAGGMDKDVHQAIIDHGCKISGCTLHFVDEGEDTGPIVIQKTVNITEEETSDSLKSKVQTVEKEALVEGARLYFENKLKVEGRKVKIL